MTSSSHRGSTTGRSTHGVDQDTYDPQQWGVRNIAARDGYDAGDGYMIPNPQLWSQSGSSDPRSSAYQQRSSYDRPRRRASTLDSESDESDDYDDRRRRSSRGLRRHKSYEGRRYYDDEVDDDRGDRGQNRAGGMIKRSMSQLRTTLKDAFSGDDDEDGKGNTEAKKLAATVSGALVGGLAGRQARKDNWVPAAIGAFIGGFAARELEKQFYRRKDAKREEEEAYGGRRSRSGSRPGSRG